MAEEEWPAWQSKKADWMLWYMINDRHQTYVDCVSPHLEAEGGRAPHR
jgi:hypothetical protein